MNEKYIKIAETELGFEKCFPYAAFGDGSARWLKGGGLWDIYDTIAFVKYKISLTKELQTIS